MCTQAVTVCAQAVTVCAQAGRQAGRPNRAGGTYVGFVHLERDHRPVVLEGERTRQVALPAAHVHDVVAPGHARHPVGERALVRVRVRVRVGVRVGVRVRVGVGIGVRVRVRLTRWMISCIFFGLTASRRSIPMYCSSAQRPSADCRWLLAHEAPVGPLRSASDALSPAMLAARSLVASSGSSSVPPRTLNCSGSRSACTVAMKARSESGHTTPGGEEQVGRMSRSARSWKDSASRGARHEAGRFVQ